MREVGFFRYKFSLDKVNWIEEVCRYNYHYMLNPKEEEIIETNYEEVDKYSFPYMDRDGFLGLFGKPVKVIETYDKKLMIHEDDTVYVKKTWHKDNCTIEELSRRLNADDFIQYMRDKGMNVCPISVM